MNSGLYDRAGVSATRSAAAWAKRFDPPVTNASKVYLSFSVAWPAVGPLIPAAVPAPSTEVAAGSPERMSASSSNSGSSWGGAGGRASRWSATSTRPISARLALSSPA